MAMTNADDEARARQIVRTVFHNTACSPETLERVMIERIAAYLTQSRNDVVDLIKRKRDGWARQVEPLLRSNEQEARRIAARSEAANELLRLIEGREG